MYITVKEASELTGKSPTTIYRLCNKRRNSLHVKKEDNKFLINKDFLLATYPPDENSVNEQIEPIQNWDDEAVELVANNVIEPVLSKMEETDSDFLDSSDVVEEELIKPFGKNRAEEAGLLKGSSLEFSEHENVADDANSDFREMILGVAVSIIVIALILFLFYAHAR